MHYKLYGITKYTIANPLGNLFSFDLSTNTYTVLHENDSLTGYAAGTLLNIGGGILIGTANSNSAASTPDYGVLYSYDLNTNTRTVLHHFDTLTGFGVHAQLLLASDGKIYGTSSAGGTSYPNNLYFPLGHGVIFSFDLNTNVYSVLYNYEIAISGSENQCGMMQASNGLLYTATYDACKLFSYDIGSNTFTIVNNFTGVSGINPSSPLIEIGAVTAINNKDNNNKISVSPNPAQGYIMINNRDTASIVTCIDILGREIEQIQLVDFGKTRVDLSAFPNVFFVKDNYGEVLKVMKQ